jgi:hypothetical protein
VGAASWHCASPTLFGVRAAVRPEHLSATNGQRIRTGLSEFMYRPDKPFAASQHPEDP